MERMPAAAGQFYPSSPTQLRSLIASLVDAKAQKEDIIGAVAPHAGYPYSGPVAGAVISRIKFKETFIIIGPNHTGRGKPFSIMTEGSWKTPLGSVQIDTALGKKLLAGTRYLQEDTAAHEMEHSVEVQVPFLQYFKPDVRILPIVIGFSDGRELIDAGKEIARAIRETGNNAVILASSDMTHYEPQESAKKKDTAAIKAILEMDAEKLLQTVEHLDISMCGAAPVAVLIAAARELGATSAELVKYQTSGDTTGDYSAVVGYAGIIVRAKEVHPLVKLAQQAVETYVRKGEVLSAPETLTPEMEERAGVFISIHKRGDLRGCIGTFEPTQPNVAQEVIMNAISSATRDPRFMPVAPNELKDLDYKVDVLTRPKPVPDASHLDPKKYGVIVECGWRRGLLLPDLEGVESVDQQIEICCHKGGIELDEPVKLYRFEVKRYT